MTHRIFLIGFMGSGKTTHGKQLARKLGYSFVDMDQYIEGKTGKSIPQIFKENGEAFFRRKETQAIKELKGDKNLVIATGGGAPCFGDNMDLLKAAGLTVYLHLSPGALLNRLKNSKNERPLMEGKTEQEMLDTITAMLAEREPFYNRADLIVDGMDNIDERLYNSVVQKLK